MCLFLLFLQIEDAMLMFDKATQRHRGEYFPSSATQDVLPVRPLGTQAFV